MTNNCTTICSNGFSLKENVTGLVKRHSGASKYFSQGQRDATAYLFLPLNELLLCHNRLTMFFVIINIYVIFFTLIPKACIVYLCIYKENLSVYIPPPICHWVIQFCWLCLWQCLLRQDSLSDFGQYRLTMLRCLCSWLTMAILFCRSWLLRDGRMRLRTTYSGFTHAVDSYFDKFIPKVVPLQVTFTQDNWSYLCKKQKTKYKQKNRQIH